MASWNKNFRIPHEINKPDPDISFDQDGNEIKWENLDKGKSVTLEVPFTSIGFTAAGSKEKEPQHYSLTAETVSYAVKGNNSDLRKGMTRAENGTFSLMPEDLEFTKAPIANYPTWLDLKLESLFKFLPSSYRERFIGDLREDRFNLRREGHSENWINFILIGQTLLAIRLGVLVWFSDLFGTKKEKS